MSYVTTHMMVVHNRTADVQCVRAVRCGVCVCVCGVRVRCACVCVCVVSSEPPNRDMIYIGDMRRHNGITNVMSRTGVVAVPTTSISANDAGDA
jgi:hypothetical protein